MRRNKAALDEFERQVAQLIALGVPHHIGLSQGRFHASYIDRLRKQISSLPFTIVIPDSLVSLHHQMRFLQRDVLMADTDISLDCGVGPVVSLSSMYLRLRSLYVVRDAVILAFRPGRNDCERRAKRPCLAQELLAYMRAHHSVVDMVPIIAADGSYSIRTRTEVGGVVGVVRHGNECVLKELATPDLHQAQFLVCSSSDTVR